MRPRKVVRSPLPIAPENDIRMSVAAEIMNQVLTSWLLATSPRSSASSSRFWVGSSDFSLSSSSAIRALPWPYELRIRRELAQRASDECEESSHHGTDHDEQDQIADHDRERHRDEIYLHLRHQQRQHAERDVEDDAE